MLASTPQRVAVRWLGRQGDARRPHLRRAPRRDQPGSRTSSTRSASRAASGSSCSTGRVPELYTAVLGTLSHGSVACALFSAFGPEPIRQRLELGDARVLVTTSALYRRKIARDPRRAARAAPRDRDRRRRRTTTRTCSLCAAARSSGEHVPRSARHGPDRHGAVALHERHDRHAQGRRPRARGVVAHRATGALALDLHDDDMFWCTADPGWVTGMSYGILAPLALGVTSVVDEADFDAERWYGILASRASHASGTPRRPRCG